MDADRRTYWTTIHALCLLFAGLCAEAIASTQRTDPILGISHHTYVTTQTCGQSVSARAQLASGCISPRLWPGSRSRRQPLTHSHSQSSVAAKYVFGWPLNPTRPDSAGYTQHAQDLMPPGYGVNVYGRIVNENGQPVSGVEIRARRRSHTRDRHEQLEMRATSDSRGAFVFHRVDQGSYTLVVGENSDVTRTVQHVKIYGRMAKRLPDILLKTQADIAGLVRMADGQRVASVKVSGLAGTIKRQTLSDSQGRFILGGFVAGLHVNVWAETAGRIRAERVVVAPDSDAVLVLPRAESVRGRVEDADTNVAIREFRIGISPSQERSFHSEDGNFEWSGVQPGRLHVTAKAAGYQKEEIDTIIGAAEELVPPLVFKLNRGAELAGRVLDDETGTAVSGVALTYRDPRQAAWPDHLSSELRVADSEGSFVFDGLPSGGIEITATSPSYSQTKLMVTVGQQDFIEIRLRRSGSVAGFVLDADSNTPVPGASVSISNPDAGSTLRTSADNAGFFYFGDLSAGHYLLDADTAAGRAQPEEVVLGVEQHIAGITLVVKPGTTIRGRITGIAGSELQVVDVTARSSAGFFASVSTDLGGGYAIHGVPTGSIQLQAQTSNNRVMSRALEVPDGGRELIADIEFPLSGHLHGHIRRSGQAVAFEPVAAFPAEPALAAWVGETDRDGAYAADGLSEGNYVIRVAGAQTKFIHVSRDTLLDIELP